MKSSQTTQDNSIFSLVKRKISHILNEKPNLPQGVSEMSNIIDLSGKKKTAYPSVSIRWVHYNYGFSQVHSSGIQFSPVSNNRINASNLFFCKDYLQDIIFAELFEKTVTQYGLNHIPRKEIPFNVRKNGRILMGDSTNKTFYNNIPNILSFINAIEEKMNISKTKAFEISSAPKEHASGGVFLFVFSKVWMKSAQLISLYSLLLRVGISYDQSIGIDNFINLFRGKTNQKTTRPEDARYLCSSIPLLDALMVEGGYLKYFSKNIKENFDPSINSSSLHGGGVVQFCSYFFKNKPEGNSITFLRTIAPYSVKLLLDEK